MAKDAIGDYRILDTLEGHGRQAYYARKSGDRGERRYVILLLDLPEGQLDALSAELERCRSVGHPAIAAFVELFDHEGHLAVVLESMAGVSLERLVTLLTEEGNELSDGSCFHLGCQLFEALAAAHVAKDPAGKTTPLVHAQLGTHQLFLGWDGEVKLLGLGLSLAFRLASTAEVPPAAASPYIAPEVRKGGALTVRANVYSAAAMVWSLLARTPPPEDGSRPESLSKLRPDLPSAVSHALDRALAPSLLERRISAMELARALVSAELADTAQLRGHLEWARAIESFDEFLIGPESLPPSKLSDVVASSMAPLIDLAPDSDGFSAMVTIPAGPLVPSSVDIIFDAEDVRADSEPAGDDTAVTIPAPPRRRGD